MKKDQCLTDPLFVESFIQEVFAKNLKRLRHSVVVADRVRQSARDINERKIGYNIDESIAYCAALLHDLGYWEKLGEQTFHPLDGSSYLIERGYPYLASLIACHSFSPEEASLKGLGPITISEDIIAKLITYWDMQVGPNGEILSYSERIADIIIRYGKDSLIGKANLLAQPRIELLISEIDRLLGKKCNA